MESREYTHISNSLVSKIRERFSEFKENQKNVNYNSMIGQLVEENYYTFVFYNSNEDTRFTLKYVKSHNANEITFSSGEGLLIENSPVDATGSTSYTTLFVDTGRNKERVTELDYFKVRGNSIRSGTGYFYSNDRTLVYNTMCFYDEPYKSEFKGNTEKDLVLQDLVDEMKKNFSIKQGCNDPQPPTQGGGSGQNSGGQTNNSTCSNTGQFGGGGTPLKDIKLFLYANKVTKGTITLSKPQVEVGTYATDWRPNPADATKNIEMILKQIESGRKGGRKNGKKRD